MKKILVTGGAGFLGSHLCERLLKEGNSVVCLDNLSTGNIKNIANIVDNPCFEFIIHDITSPIFLKVDQIYNLACPASPNHYQSNPLQTTKTCVYGLINMLDLARQINARILQASTSEVYGDPEVNPQSEKYWGRVNPNGIRSCYNEGKRCAETLCLDYYRQYNTDVKIIRIFNAYGPRMLPYDGRVISSFVVQALKGEDITVYGEGKQTRSFCYVDDMIDAIISMMNTMPGLTGPINIGNPDECTIYEMANKVISLTDSSSRIIFHPLPSDDPMQRRTDISLAQKEIGWYPKVDVEEGLIKTINYYHALLMKKDMLID